MLLACTNCHLGISVTQDRYLDVIEELAKNSVICKTGRKHEWLERSLEEGGNNERSTE